MEKDREEGRKEGASRLFRTGGRSLQEGLVLRDVGRAGMPFRTPPGVLGGHKCSPEASAWGGTHLGADALPARRTLPHFLSCERAWVRSDWHGAVPGNYKTGGRRETGLRTAFPVTPSGHSSGTSLPPEA